MQLYFTDPRQLWKVGAVAGASYDDLRAVFEQARLAASTPILLDDSMRPVEPLSSWFRSLGQQGLDGKTMRAYAYTSLMLVNFLAARGLDLGTAAEADLLDFRR